ncbi:MAG TPA: hypothetical protein VHF07_07565, partial [Nitrospiraceae bacterium]|nr:hypothetical protein [Nitrospiraceae bacterium]
MATPMMGKDGTFGVTIDVEHGATVEYGFLVTKTAGGAFIEFWDGDESYRRTATQSETVDVRSVRLYQNVPVLIDRAGAKFVPVIALIFIGLLTTA